MNRKGTIKNIERRTEARYTYGTNFTKGDFLWPIVSFIVYVRGEAPFEVKREKLLSFAPGRKKVTEPYLDTFKGKDANILR